MAINKRNKFELLKETRETEEIIETPYIPEVKKIKELPLEKTVIKKELPKEKKITEPQEVNKSEKAVRVSDEDIKKAKRAILDYDLDIPIKDLFSIALTHYIDNFLKKR